MKLKDMKIKEPIFLLDIVGDVKQYVDTIPDTIKSEYDSELNSTLVAVKAENKNHAKFVEERYKRLHSDIQLHENKYNQKQITVRYLENGFLFN